MINKGFSYSFTVQLCNFLGACGESSVQVLAVDSIVPIVTIPGNALRQSVRGAILTISSSAAVSACGVVNTNAKLVYAWSIRESSVLSPLAVYSISRDPSKFILPAYSLRSNTYYTVSISVYVENSAQSAKATTTVLVPVGGLYAVLSDGLTRSMRAGSSIVIDASSSYDEDVSVLTGTAAGLLFSWSCMQTAPVFNQSCNGLYTIATDAELLVIAEPASTGFAYQLTVQVSDSSGARQAQSSVALSVLSPAAALVHIITLPSKSAYTPTSNVTLSYPLPSSAVKPTVVVNTPSEIGTCAGLSIDMSYSSGSGGQPWKSITTFVYGSNASAAKDPSVASERSRSWQCGSSPFSIHIPWILQYRRIVVQLPTACNSGFSSVTVYDILMPTVSIFGLRSRRVKRSVPLQLSSEAYVPSCDGDSLRNGLSYAWSVFVQDVLQPTFQSISNVPNVFMLPADTLDIGGSYVRIIGWQQLLRLIAPQKSE
jgi:hypothetical protein